MLPSFISLRGRRDVLPSFISLRGRRDVLPSFISLRDRRGRDRMVVGFTIAYAIGAYQH